MPLEFELIPDDVRAWWKYHRRKGPRISNGQIPRWVLFLLASILSVFIIVFFICCAITNAPDPFYFVIGLIVGVFYGTAIFVIFNYYQLKNPRLYRRNQFVLDHKGIQTANANCECLYYWSSMVAVGVTKDHLFLYPSADLGLIFPRRVFPDEEAFKAFIDDVYTHLDADENSRLGEQSRHAEGIQSGGAVRTKKVLPKRKDHYNNRFGRAAYIVSLTASPDTPESPALPCPAAAAPPGTAARFPEYTDRSWRPLPSAPSRPLPG